jgi:hypothetical protein
MPEVEGFEVKKMGNKETTIKIVMQLYHNAPKFKV